MCVDNVPFVMLACLKIFLKKLKKFFFLYFFEESLLIDRIEIMLKVNKRRISAFCIDDRISEAKIDLIKYTWEGFSEGHQRSTGACSVA